VPYTPVTPTVVLCQALAAYVAAQWEPAAPSAVDWDFFRRYGDADQISVPALQGRQVVFFPAAYDWENATRAEEGYQHHVQAVVVERYTDAAGDPPRDWTSARVDFVYGQLIKGLRFNRSGPAPFNPALVTLRGHVEVLDVDKLMASGKLFFALAHLEFFELVP
jgi:hypothetical protein